MQSLNKVINNWLLNTWKPTLFHLGLTRILFCMGLFFLGLPEFSGISTREIVFFDPPPGLSKFIGPIVSESFWWFFDLLIRIIFVALLFGYKTKISSFLFGSFLIFGYTYLFSYGKIDHDIYAVIFPLIMAFSNWGSAFSIDALLRKKREIKPQGWTLSYLSFILGWGYFTAGIPKLLAGWLDPYNSTTAGFILRKFYLGENNIYLVKLFAHIDNLLIYKIMDYGTLVFELGFILTIFSSRWFFKALGVATTFHLGVLLTLNIAFSMHLLVFMPFLLIYHFENESVMVENTKKFLMSFIKPIIGSGLVLGILIIINFNPFLWIPYRSHFLLFVLCLFSMLMLLPKAWLKFLPSKKEASFEGFS